MMLRNSPVSWTCSMHTLIRMIVLQSKGLYWNVWGKTDEWVEIRTEEVWSCFKRTNQHSAHGDHITGAFSAVLGHLPCPSSLEDSYHHPCTKETFPQSTEWRLPCCPHFHPFQVYGETASSKTQCSSHTPRTEALRTLTLTLTLLHHVYKHLEKPKSYVWLPFLDFSSAFNTIQPHLMLKKLMEMDVNSYFTRWIFSFLTNRPQHVRISNSTSEVLSNEIWINTGAPQGCVLSPALFTLYTSDCCCGATTSKVFRWHIFVRNDHQRGEHLQDCGTEFSSGVMKTFCFLISARPRN